MTSFLMTIQDEASHIAACFSLPPKASLAERVFKDYEPSIGLADWHKRNAKHELQEILLPRVSTRKAFGIRCEIRVSKITLLV